MLKINAFSFNPFSETTFIVWDEESAEAAVIDPGMSTVQENARFDQFIDQNHLQIRYLVNTHMHLDHIFGDNHVKEKYGIAVSAHPDDRFLGSSLGQQAKGFGMSLPASATAPVEIGHELKEGDRIPIGKEYLEVISTPGHTPGSISLYCPDSGFVISGDTLFRRGVGRTDLPGGDSAALQSSIVDKLYKLPESTLVVPGHGPTTTIGEEKRSNPFA